MPTDGGIVYSVVGRHSMGTVLLPLYMGDMPMDRVDMFCGRLDCEYTKCLHGEGGSAMIYTS